MALRRWSSLASQARLQQLLQQQAELHSGSKAVVPAVLRRLISDQAGADRTAHQPEITWIGSPIPPAPQAKPQLGAASAAPPSNDESQDTSPPNYPVSFNGFFAVPHKRLKYVSLVQAFIATASAPLMILNADDPNMATSAAVAGTMVACLGWVTTAAFHWFTSPYVHRLEYDPEGRRVHVYTLSIIGREQKHSFSVSEVKHADTWRPLATFQARGRVFYLEQQHFPDKQLLRALSPQDPALAQMEQAAALQRQQEQEHGQ